MQYALTSAAGYWTARRPDDPYPVHLDCGTRLNSLPEDEWLCPKCEVAGGLLEATHPNRSSRFHRTVLEAASWRLASELVARHPNLRVHRTFPHPGTSDVLRLAPEGRDHDQSPGPVIYLNRDEGRIHVLKRSDGMEMEVEGGPWTWDEYLTYDEECPPVLERIEDAAGLWLGHEDKPPSREGMLYALIARIAALALMDQPFDIRNGCASEFSDTRPDWWDEIAVRNPELTAPGPDDRIDVGYRFWRIERDDFALTIETSTGTAWGHEYDADEVEALGY
ncbi:TY-Chap2 family putative peptide chaperone, partial [Nocardioides sp. P5_C9_2]